MIITCKPLAEMTLAELRGEYFDFTALLARTHVRSARAKVAGVCDLIGAWIAKREREAEGVAA